MVFPDKFSDKMHVYEPASALPLAIGLYFYWHNPISIITIAVLAATMISTWIIATSV